jgi:AcrR family transcriptional regulator
MERDSAAAAQAPKPRIRGARALAGPPIAPAPARSPARRRARLPREERERIVLDAAAELFYARGVHEVGMDELVRATGLGKATVYRLFPTKDALIGAYLGRLAGQMLERIDADVALHDGDAAAAVVAIFTAVAGELARPHFRGCAFNNASIEFADPDHPARVAAREYRAALHDRLVALAGPEAGGRLALLLDGMYTSAAHLGATGPAAAGPALARQLMEAGAGRDDRRPDAPSAQGG